MLLKPKGAKQLKKVKKEEVLKELQANGVQTELMSAEALDFISEFLNSNDGEETIPVEEENTP